MPNEKCRRAFREGKRPRLLFRAWLFRVPLFLPLALIAAAAPGPSRFAGAVLAPGATVPARVPLSAIEKQYTSEGGNSPPPYAVAVLAVPEHFDPRKSWPVLVVLATDDSQRLNRDDLAQIYRHDALEEGWLVLAGDGPKFPPRGTSGWRAGTTLAALDALHRSFPGSQHWPVAVAGFSGGAKQAGLLAPLLYQAGCDIAGVYLTGINSDSLTHGYRSFHPAPAFLHTPIFLSSGLDDPIARPEDQRAIFTSIRKTGFDRIRMENFAGGHAVKLSHLHEALRWFRQLLGS